MKNNNTWFKADYTNAEGNKIKKRSNEKIYKDIFKSIDDDYAPLNTFLDYEASYKEWIKKNTKKEVLIY